MSSYLWKVKSNKAWANIPKGLEVDVVVSNRSGKPNIKEISEAIINKYKITPKGGMPESTFDFTKG